ncbi:MAG: hypothetical protein NDI94_06700 [Candidatus Woesearchaeota archaeon]|nr:hypothetical protein [Candidatus Woesearchaeota archaeon]
MKYPSHEECINWYKEQKTPDNIMAHVKKVNEVANFLAEKLTEKGIRINLEIVDKASLLHDLDKWMCINDKSIDHGFETERILTKKGFPDLGFYARQHRADIILDGLNSWEEKIIAYADKRCNDDNVVSLKERFDYVNVKYPAKDIEKRKREMRLFYELEEEIFRIIGISPDKLPIR